MKLVYFVLLPLLLVTLPASSQGKDFPKTIRLDQKKLILNGSGWRTASWFNVKVYHAALYLEKKVSPDKILESQQHKVIDIRFNREIKVEDLKKVWGETFEKTCEKSCSVKYGDFIKDLKNIKKGDTQRYSFSPTQVKVVRQGQESLYEGKNFSQLVLKTFIGTHPPTEDLKEALLGMD